MGSLIYQQLFFTSFIGGILVALSLYIYYARKVKRAEAEAIPFARLGKFMILFSIAVIVVLTPLSIDMTTAKRNPSPEQISYNGATAVEGWKVAIDYNCMGCHTIVGNGAYYAPELTYIARKAGTPEKINARISAYMGSQFMPFELTEREEDALTAWMLYLRDLNTNNWPPMEANDYSFSTSFDKNVDRWYESFDAWAGYWVLTLVFTVFLVFSFLFWYERG
jgi:nitric oxide reductase subunit C